MGIKSYIRLLYKAFRQKLYYFFKPEIHIISDSHGEAFRQIDFKVNYGYKANFCIVPGATASGLANPNSKTQAFPIFQKYIKEHVKKNDFIILHLGEVDCGFTIWLRAKHKDLQPNVLMKEALHNYTSFINNYITSFSTNIIICSAILPTISDEIPKGEIANLRRKITANQIQRTNITLNFNKSLEDYCTKCDYHYLNLDFFLYDERTKVIKNEFLNDDKYDHHPNPLRIAEIVKHYLDSIL